MLTSAKFVAAFRSSEALLVHDRNPMNQSVQYHTGHDLGIRCALLLSGPGQLCPSAPREPGEGPSMLKGICISVRSGGYIES